MSQICSAMGDAKGIINHVFHASVHHIGREEGVIASTNRGDTSQSHASVSHSETQAPLPSFFPAVLQHSCKGVRPRLILCPVANAEGLGRHAGEHQPDR